VFSAGPDQVSRAALHGGTTTLLDFALSCRTSRCSSRSSTAERVHGSCYCDYGFHLMLRGTQTGVAERAAEAVQGAIPRSRSSRPTSAAQSGRMVKFGDIWEC